MLRRRKKRRSRLIKNYESPFATVRALIVDHSDPIPGWLMKLLGWAERESGVLVIYFQQDPQLQNPHETLCEGYTAALKLALSRKVSSTANCMFLCESEERRRVAYRIGCLSATCPDEPFVYNQLENYGLVQQLLLRRSS